MSIEALAGKLRELIDAGLICGKPRGHLDDCDPPPTVAGWGMP